MHQNNINKIFFKKNDVSNDNFLAKMFKIYQTLTKK